MPFLDVLPSGKTIDPTRVGESGHIVRDSAGGSGN